MTLEILLWALFSGCVVALFLAPLVALFVVGEMIDRKLNDKKDQ